MTTDHAAPPAPPAGEIEGADDVHVGRHAWIGRDGRAVLYGWDDHVQYLSPEQAEALAAALLAHARAARQEVRDAE